MDVTLDSNLLSQHEMYEYIALILPIFTSFRWYLEFKNVRVIRSGAYIVINNPNITYAIDRSSIWLTPGPFSRPSTWKLLQIHELANNHRILLDINAVIQNLHTSTMHPYLHVYDN